MLLKHTLSLFGASLLLAGIQQVHAACDPCVGDTVYSNNLLATVQLPDSILLGNLSNRTVSCQLIKALTDDQGTVDAACTVLEVITEFQDNCCADPDDNPFICFSGRSTVEVEDKGTTPMRELQIGDSVLTAEGTYSSVYSFGHREPNLKTEFLQIQTDTDKHHHPLEISSDHLLYKHNLQTKKKEAVPASSIKVGDWIVSDGGSPVKVSSISKIIRTGAYSPLTGSGNLLVNGIMASTYAMRPWMKDWVSGEMLHFLQHGAALPFRLYCAVAGCQDETYDEETGFPPLLMFGYRIEQWQLGLHPVLQALFLMVMAVPASLLVIVGMLLTVPAGTTVMHLLVCFAGYFIWKKAHGKPGSGFNKEEMKVGSKH